MAREVQRLTGIATKREAVDSALRLLLRLERQARVRQGRGRLHWEGDLDELRRAR